MFLTLLSQLYFRQCLRDSEWKRGRRRELVIISSDLLLALRGEMQRSACYKFVAAVSRAEQGMFTGGWTT